MTMIIIFVLATVARYLLVDAMITQFLWTRYPEWLDHLLSCAACSGFWLTGFVAASMGLIHGGAAFGFRIWHPFTILVLAFLGIFTTPLLTALHTKAMRYIGDRPDSDA